MNMTIMISLTASILLLCVLSTADTSTQEIPVIQPFSFPALSTIGETVNVICGIAKGSQPLQFLWLKDAQDVAKVPNLSVHSQNLFSVLTVGPASKENVGNYTCIARNSQGKDEHTASFVLNETPTWSFEPTDMHVTEGQFIEVPCRGEGHPRPQITWAKHEDGTTSGITLGHHQNAVQSYENGSLVISSVKENHSGTYTCKISNNVGNPLQKNIKISVSEFLVL